MLHEVVIPRRLHVSLVEGYGGQAVSLQLFPFVTTSQATPANPEVRW